MLSESESIDPESDVLLGKESHVESLLNHFQVLAKKSLLSHFRDHFNFQGVRTFMGPARS